MSVVKITSYHGKQAIENVKDYVEDAQKTAVEFDYSDVSNAIGYAENEAKTGVISADGHTVMMVKGHNCKVSLACEAFQRCEDQYRRNGHSENVGKHYKAKTLFRAKLDTNGKPILDRNGEMIFDKRAPVYHNPDGSTIPYEAEKINQARSCYMWVISFPPASILGYEIDPRLVMQISEEFMTEIEKVNGQEFPGIIAIHNDKKHKHAHIVHSAFSMDGHSKYKDTMENLMKAREIGDRLSQKYGLPIIMEPTYKSMSHEEWALVQQGSSWKQTIRDEIAYNLERSRSYTEFLANMKSSGFDYRETENHLTWYTPGNSHRCRDSNLNAKEYTKEAILAYYNEKTLEQHKAVQREKEEIIDPTLPENQIAPVKIYVSRYTMNGRRRSDLEMLLIKAIKILKYFKDKFSDIDTTDNPIRKSSDWKTQRLAEAIAILDTMNLHTMQDLDTKLNQIGAEHSHAKKDLRELSQGKEGLLKLKELCENISDLQMITDSLGITDFYTIPAKQKEVTTKQAELFPMRPSQRRDLFLALQEHPLVKCKVKYDEMTFSQAKACIAYLKGKSEIMPPELTTTLEPSENQEAKFQHIAEKTLESIRQNTAEKEISEKMKSMVESFNLPLDVKELSFADAVHLIAYCKPWEPVYKPCTDEAQLASEARIKQVKEILEFTGKEINISPEQLSKRDADTLFRDLSLSLIVPEAYKNAMQSEWEQSISYLTYEEKGYVDDYRTLLQTLESLGYDLSQVDDLLAQVNAQLDSIDAEEKHVKELGREYSTLRQLKAYTTLASDKRFTHGPKWKEQFDPEVFEEHIEKEIEPEEHTVENERKANRKTFEQEINADF